MSTLAGVRLWGRSIGAVSLADGAEVAAFQYTPEFAASGIEVSPVVMPLSNQVYAFPGLSRTTFHGLPGLLADSLPDRFGNALIDAWLATGRRDLRGLFAEIAREDPRSIREVTEEACRAVDPMLESFVDIDTPDDLERLQSR